MAHENSTQLSPTSRAWYESTISEFLASDEMFLLGSLANRSEFELEPAQRDAWKIEFEILRNSLKELYGRVYLEYPIPRMGRRIDVMISGGTRGSMS
jgi:hypothetical protein